MYSSTDLSSYLQYVLECHAGICKLALQKHDDVVVVLVNLLRAAMGVVLLYVGLQRRNLLVDVRYVLLDDECQFL